MNNTLLGLSLGICLFLVTAVATTKTTEQTVTDRINHYVEMLIEKKPPYVWGGYWGILGGDCSGQVAWVLKMAGVGGYPRTTSFRMWLTWPHKKKITSRADIWKEARFPNIIFFTFPNKKAPRPFGHTAWWRRFKNDKTMVMAEASSSEKYFKETDILKGDGRDVHLVGLLELNLTPGM